jgi:hypothetical protein
VTVIEILSPANKLPGSRGRELYVQKMREVLNSPSHWVEIDLLRDGERVAVGGEVPEHDYQVFVSRAHPGRRRAWIWPIRLHQRLPVIPVPLREPDPDANLDLQELLTTVYDRAGYDLDVDYTRDPNPPLAAEQAAWARGVLAERR